MRRRLALWLFMFCGALCLRAEMIERLATDAVSGINNYFSRKNNVVTGVVAFENRSGHSDQIAQRLYQLLVAELESAAGVRFLDLMIDFKNGRGRFNLKGIGSLNYTITLKLIQNREKLGLGVTIFSTYLDRIVSIRYHETTVPEGERRYFEIQRLAGEGTGFIKTLEMDMSPSLMDIARLDAQNRGEATFLLYFPDRVDIFAQRENRFEKTASISMDWKRPYFPVQEYEGRIHVIPTGNTQTFTVGANFTRGARVFVLREGAWQAAGELEFVPLGTILIGGEPYITGGRYLPGTNLFSDTLWFQAFDQTSTADRTPLYQKKVLPFLSMTIGGDRTGEFHSIHLIDSRYNYHYYMSDFEEQPLTEAEKKGAALTTLGSRWLVTSAYTRKGDRLCFYRIDNGSMRLVYKAELQNSVRFLAPAGEDPDEYAVWVYTGDSSTNRQAFTLQLWTERGVTDSAHTGEATGE